MHLFLAVSYNLPKFCGNASWNPNATTFVNQTSSMINPLSIFITKRDTVYIGSDDQKKIEVWIDGNASSIRNISTGYVFFVSDNEDIYVHNSAQQRVERWQRNGTSADSVMFSSSTCGDLFVDINNTLYCSRSQVNEVISKSLNDPTNAFKTVAGTGCAYWDSYGLDGPSGIFVDLSFDLYVADSKNNRIQRFRQGERNGTKVAGSPATASLSSPTDVVLDGDGNLYIVDSNMNRIVRSGVSGFWCVAGCTNTQGSMPFQLSAPKGLSFDSYGNIFVADSSGNRIQKFLLTNGSCGKFHFVFYFDLNSCATFDYNFSILWVLAYDSL